MRILVVSNFYPPHAFGGYELSCRDVVERWARRGHEIVVLTSKLAIPGVDGDASCAVEVRRVLDLYWQDHRILNPPLPRRLAIEAANQRVLRQALDQWRPHVASLWAMGALSMGIITTLAQESVPTVLSVCDEWPVYGPSVDAWLRPLARRRNLGRVVGLMTGLPTTPPPLDRVGPACFVSEWLRDKVRTETGEAFHDSGVVFSGVDTQIFKAGLETRHEGFKWRLLYVGRIDRRKGIATVISALAKCPPEAVLTVVGRGDDAYRRELEAQAAKDGLGDRVRFTEAERQQLPALYRSADAVVFPSAWEEPFGLVPLEAMACGVAVVASPSGGSAEFLYDGINCLEFEAQDPDGLAQALAQLAGDPTLRARLRQGGESTVNQLSVERLADELELWHLAAASRTEGRPAQRKPVIPKLREPVSDATV